MSEDNKTSGLSPKISFILGLVTGIALCGVVAVTVILVRGGEGDTKPVAGDDTVTPPADQPIVIADVTAKDHIRGKLDAPVKIVEFSDFECPFCKKHQATLQQLVADYGDKIAWVYRHFPLTSLHTQSVKEAEASECVAELGGEDAFWKFADKIYEVTPGNDGLDLTKLGDYAAEVGVDKAKFQECLDSGKKEEVVKAFYQDAINAGGQGTPHNIIIGPDGAKVPLAGAYPIEAFKQVIDKMLADQK